MNRSKSANTSGLDAGTTPPTNFAPAELATGKELANEISAISHNPVVDGLMHVANGLFAVLNDHRQVLAINEAFLKLMASMRQQYSAFARGSMFTASMPARCPAAAGHHSPAPHAGR